MKTTQLILICLLFLRGIVILNGQQSPSNYIVVKDKAQISVGYYRVARKQMDGSNVRLNKDFGFITPGAGHRFAPDEPSSFSYINYIFADNSKYFDFLVGGFRNHTKGDFLFDDIDVHFGKGNSHIGLGFGIDLGFPIKKFTLSGSVFWGYGAQFTRLTSWDKEVSPESWGLRGLGSVLVSGVNLTSPKMWKFFSVSLCLKSTIHSASFFDFEVKDRDGNIQSFEDVVFTTYGLSPMLQLNFDLRKKKKVVVLGAG